MNDIWLQRYFYLKRIRSVRTLHSCVQKIRNFYRRKSEIFTKESKITAILNMLCCHGNAKTLRYAFVYEISSA